ncbi:MAG: MFS transporter [Rickettsiales bacterium]|nr:MFS transporter [Rickettsiales bacterium]
MLALTFVRKRFNSWLIILACGLFYCYQFSLRVLPNTFSQEFMNAFHVEAAGLGIIIAAYSAAYAGLQIPLGCALDRIKVHYLLPLAPLICGSGAALMVFADNIIYASAARFIIGVGSAFGFIGAVKVATRILPANRISMAIGVTIFFGTLGAMIAGRPLKWLSEIYSWKEVMLYMACIGAILSVILLMALSSVLIKTKRHETFLAKRSMLKDLKILFKNPQITLLSLYGMLTYLPITVLGIGWGVGYIMLCFKVEYSIAATSVAFMFMGAGIGSPIIAMLSEIFHSRRTIMILSSLMAAILYFLLLYGNYSLSEYQIYLCLFLAGVFYSSKTLSFTIACDLVSKNHSALVTSILNMTVMASGLIFHPLIGFLLNKGHSDLAIYSKYDYQVALCVLPISALCAFILLLFIKDNMLQKTIALENKLVAIDE